jgi:DNA-binding NarL/FixJ family response regulator
MARRPVDSTCRVSVASNQPLVAEAIRAALVTHHFDAFELRWPESSGPITMPESAEVGLLVSDLNRSSHIKAAETLLRVTRGTRWLVLTSADRGPAWGAMINAGARMVWSSTSKLEDVIAMLLDLFVDAVDMEEDERDELGAAWTEFLASRELLLQRVDSLSPRELEVLDLLYAGDSVAQIALTFEVSTTTVRSQVKAILRKLQVNTQVAAVAAVAVLREERRRSVTEVLSTAVV